MQNQQESIRVDGDVRGEVINNKASSLKAGS
jgi:hypothetical protein